MFHWFYLVVIQPHIAVFIEYIVAKFKNRNIYKQYENLKICTHKISKTNILKRNSEKYIKA